MIWRYNHNLFLVAYVLSLIAAICAISSTGSKVLVVIEPQVNRKEFEGFFAGLKSKGYELTFRAPLDEKPSVLDSTIPNFDHVIFFSPTAKKYASDITQQSIVSLVSKGVNVIVTLSPTQTPLSSLASEFSLILPPPGTPLLSYFPQRDPPYTTLPISPPSSKSNSKEPYLSSILSSSSSNNNNNPILFSGIPHAFGNNPYLIPILRAPAESFAAEVDGASSPDVVYDASDKGGEGLWAGSAMMGVVSGFQASVEGGSAGRVLWVGGIDVFSDRFANAEVSTGVKSGNAQFVQDVTAWTFQESMVLRIDDVSHHRLNETSTPEQYTTNDEVVYTIHISKYSPTKSSWEPYSGLTDLQLEFTMLDPHIRTSVPAVRGRPGEYSVTFRAPDRHGVFKFVIDYKRKGWTYLYSARTVPVVPPRHDGYPRFLSAAWPYYAGAISTSIGFVIFSALWLGGDVSEKGLGKKAKSKSQKTE